MADETGLSALCKAHGIGIKQLEAYVDGDLSRRALFDWAGNGKKAKPALIRAIVAGAALFIKANQQGDIVESDEV